MHIQYHSYAPEVFMHILPGTLFLFYLLNRRSSLTAHSHLHCIPRLGGGGAHVLDVLFKYCVLYKAQQAST